MLALVRFKGMQVLCPKSKDDVTRVLPLQFTLGLMHGKRTPLLQAMLSMGYFTQPSTQCSQLCPINGSSHISPVPPESCASSGSEPDFMLS